MGQVANCTDPKTFDYFDGSEVSYALTWLFAGLFCVGKYQAIFANLRVFCTVGCPRNPLCVRFFCVSRDFIHSSFPGVVLVMLFLAKRRQKMLAEKRKSNRRKTQRNSKPVDNEFIGKRMFKIGQSVEKNIIEKGC